MLQMDLTEDQCLYLQRILDCFQQQYLWPTHHELDQWFIHYHPDLDIEEIWKSLPLGLTSYMDLNQAESRATLTVPAVYILKNNTHVLSSFLELIKFCVKTYLAGKSEISSEKKLEDHALLWDKGVFMAGRLLQEEPNICRQFGWTGQSGHWTCTLAREIRRFRGITTIEDYLEKRDLPRQSIRVPTTLPMPDTRVVLPVEAIQLHLTIREKCWSLYMQGNYDEAIFNATKAIEVAVRTKANLPDTCIGKDVINTAFSSKNPLLRYSGIDGEQEGMMSLLRGIIQVYKNPQSHRHVGVQNRAECLGLLLMCSNLLSVIETLQVENPGEETK